MNTGYDERRCAGHDWLVDQICYMLKDTVYAPIKLPVCGDLPDLFFLHVSGEPGLLDAKFMNIEQGRNYVVKVGAFHRAMGSTVPTYFMAEDFLIHSTVSLQMRYVSGPNPPTVNGSNTHWYLFRRGGGVPFKDFFP